jgi:hypothetical protein
MTNVGMSTTFFEILLQVSNELCSQGFNVPKASPPHNPGITMLRAKVRESKAANRFAGLHDPSRVVLCGLVGVAQVIVGDVGVSYSSEAFSRSHFSRSLTFLNFSRAFANASN